MEILTGVKNTWKLREWLDWGLVLKI